jgi:hypothetical protein
LRQWPRLDGDKDRLGTPEQYNPEFSYVDVMELAEMSLYELAAALLRGYESYSALLLSLLILQ